jgi:tetratricopeptide (TPR) repeat protein
VLAVENVVSVDMRFTISFVNFFIFAAIASALNGGPKPLGELNGELKEVSPLRWVGVAAWVALLIGVAMPAVVKPYAAQKEVANTPGFFDQRLLDPAKTIGDLEKLAAEFPTEPNVFEKLAYVYAKEMKKPDGTINRDMTEKAIVAFQTVVSLDPKRVGAYNNLANIYYTIGQTDNALKTWEKAIEVKPDFLDARMNLGKIYYVQGRLKEAAAHFETVLKIDPNHAEAIVYMKRMVE